MRTNARGHRYGGEPLHDDLPGEANIGSPAEFDVDIQSETVYYAIDTTLSAKLAKVAQQHGVSTGTLLNLWVQEKLQEQASVSAS